MFTSRYGCPTWRTGTHRRPNWMAILRPPRPDFISCCTENCTFVIRRYLLSARGFPVDFQLLSFAPFVFCVIVRSPAPVCSPAFDFLMHRWCGVVFVGRKIAPNGTNGESGNPRHKHFSPGTKLTSIWPWHSAYLQTRPKCWPGHYNTECAKKWRSYYNSTARLILDSKWFDHNHYILNPAWWIFISFHIHSAL